VAALETFITDADAKITELDTIEKSDQNEQSKQAAKTRVLRTLAAALAQIGKDHGLADLTYEKLGVSDIVVNKLIYGAMARAQGEIASRRKTSAEGAQTDDGADLSKSFDILMHRTVKAYDGACTATTADAKGFRGNVFEFAGREFFVDHDANYIVPDEEVGPNRHALDGKVYIASAKPKTRADLDKDKVRALIDKYAYTGVSTSIDKFKQDAMYAAAGGTMDPKVAVMFLAGMIAEARRNPNAHVTNLLLMKAGGSGPFFGAAPMTTGGTSAAEKFRDPTLAEHMPGGGQPPMTVTDAEIALVRREYEKAQGMTVEDAIATLGGDKAFAEDLYDFLIKSSHLMS
jgi:hypothetical protein